jgi:L-rhamnose isomerase
MIRTDGHQDRAFDVAREQYAEWQVNVDVALERLSEVAISLHCWQGDDLGGFENSGQEIGGGLAVTGNYPGKARNPDELRSDLEVALTA